jgi:CGNR zinc finger/Putative stress-induced transcription regulator
VSTRGFERESSAPTRRSSRTGDALKPMEPPSGDQVVSAGLLCLEFVSLGRQLRANDVDATLLEAKLTDWFARFGLPGPLSGVTVDDLARARSLSHAIDAIARSLVASFAPDAQDVRDLNEFARHRTPIFLLRGDGRQRVAREENDTAAAFSVVARDAISTFATINLRRLRSCEGCDLLFYDRSPSGQRRWCSMKRCGERAASALYRERHASRAKASEVLS